jgi:hypothetical protein
LEHLSDLANENAESSQHRSRMREPGQSRAHGAAALAQVVDEQRPRGGLRPSGPWLPRLALYAASRIEKRAEERQGSDAVRNHVVQADEQRDVAVRQPGEEPHLLQRA